MKYFKSITILALLLTCSIGFSQIPGQLKELVGKRASSLDGAMNRNGYMHIKSDASGYDAYDYYWNYNAKKCVVSRVSNGYVASITATLPFDCNKGGNNSTSGNHHSAHHHNDMSHYPTANVDQAFERGHTDGLYNLAYHNIYKDSAQKNAYSNGYNSGIDQRHRHSYHHSGHSAYHSHVQIDDLMGMKAVSAYGELTRRGFVEENKASGSGTTYRVWYNNRTQQCVRTTSQHEQITHIQASDGCAKG